MHDIVSIGWSCLGFEFTDTSPDTLRAEEMSRAEMVKRTFVFTCRHPAAHDASGCSPSLARAHRVLARDWGSAAGQPPDSMLPSSRPTTAQGD